MKRINWLDHFANLLVVILGISIAFYLERYKEESNNQKQEVKYLESLVTDLETDGETLDTLIIINESILEALNNLSFASIGRSYGTDSMLRAHLFAIQYNPPFTPQRTTYESLKASGKLGLIDDFEIRNNILDVYEQYYRGTNEYDAAINEHLRDFLKPFCMKNIRFTSAKSIDSDFLSENEFRNMIFGYRNLFLSKHAFYQEVVQHTNRLKSELVTYKESITP